MVLPDKNAVITVLSNLEDTGLAEKMRLSLWDMIYPQL
jgi:hypothetical protein